MLTQNSRSYDGFFAILSEVDMENTMTRRRYSEEKRSFFNLGLRYESPAKAVRYFCTPKKAEIFASLGVGGIHFCTIPSFGELVFAVVPEAADGRYVFPVANDMAQFFSLVASLSGAGLIDQIPSMTKETFERQLSAENAHLSPSVTAELEELVKLFDVKPLEGSPYDSVMALYNNFDYSKIPFTDEYYETLGIKPKKRSGSDFCSVCVVNIPKK